MGRRLCSDGKTTLSSVKQILTNNRRPAKRITAFSAGFREKEADGTNSSQSDNCSAYTGSTTGDSRTRKGDSERHSVISPILAGARRFCKIELSKATFATPVWAVDPSEGN